MIADLFFFSCVFLPSCIYLHSALRVMDTNEHQGGLQFQESCYFGPFSSLHGVGFDQGYFLSWAVPIPSTSRAVVQTVERHFTLHYFIIPSYFYFRKFVFSDTRLFSPSFSFSFLLSYTYGASLHASILRVLFSSFFLPK